MTEERPLITVETLLYIIVLVFGAWLRLRHLATYPLSDGEAAHALAAASVTPDASPYWSDGQEATPLNAAYHTLTALIFQLFGAHEVGARLVSALAGVGLILTPLFARKRIGHSRAIILASLFAFSPVLIAASRTAGGPAFTVLGLGSVLMLLVGADSGEDLRDRGPWIAGLLGLTLATGPSAIYGLVTVGLGMLILSFIGDRSDFLVAKLGRSQIRLGAWIALGVMILVAGGAGFSLRGLAGLAESLGTWFSGWFTPSTLPSLTALVMFPLYEPLTFVFGVIGLIFALRRQDALGRGTVAWGLASFLILVVYPLRQGSDLVWVMLPISFLAATTLESVFNRIANRESWLEFAGLAGALIVIGLLFFMNLAIYTSGAGLTISAGQLDPALRLVVIFGLLIAAALIVVFFGLGWNMDVAVEASAFSSTLFLVVLTLSAVWHLNFSQRTAGARELWRPLSASSGIYRLQEAIETISQSNTGRTDKIDVYVRGTETPASIAWILREFQPIPEDSEESPSLYLTLVDSDLSVFEGKYIGQSFNLREQWGWSGFLPPEPITWWINREAPTNEEHWFLLVRVDLAHLGEEILSSPVLE